MYRKILSNGRFVIPRKFADKLQIIKFENMDITIQYGKICICRFNRDNVKYKRHTGIVRRPNSDLIIQIPKEYMSVLRWKENDLVNCYLKGDSIILSKI